MPPWLPPFVRRISAPAAAGSESSGGGSQLHGRVKRGSKCAHHMEIYMMLHPGSISSRAAAASETVSYVTFSVEIEVWNIKTSKVPAPVHKVAQVAAGWRKCLPMLTRLHVVIYTNRCCSQWLRPTSQQEARARNRIRFNFRLVFYWRDDGPGKCRCQIIISQTDAALEQFNVQSISRL